MKKSVSEVFEPSSKILEKYADVMVRFALNSGKGIKKGDVVYLSSQIPGLPLLKAVYNAVISAGGNPIVNIKEDSLRKILIDRGSKKQLLFFPESFQRGLVDSMDHYIHIMADKDPEFLKHSDPKKIITLQKSSKLFHDLTNIKEDRGKFTWSLCLYATEANAHLAGLSHREYWKEVQTACFLDFSDPIAQWRKVQAKINDIKKTLDNMNICTLRVTGQDTDLRITMGENRRWLGGSGRNIPSFEIYTSPDWRGTEGHVYFDLPLYHFGNLLQGIYLEFKNGRVVKATAKKNQQLLREMIKQKNADKIGEFSLTDRRLSKITRFMADSLFDENHGGRYGNMHIALGNAYHDTYSQNVSSMKKADFEKLGFNHSIEHTDIIATTDRTVTATLSDGSETVIYTKGKFTF